MNIFKKAFGPFFTALAILSFVACCSVVQAASFTAPKKLADYLYYIEYKDYTVDLKTGEDVKSAQRKLLRP